MILTKDTKLEVGDVLQSEFTDICKVIEVFTNTFIIQQDYNDGGRVDIYAIDEFLHSNGKTKVIREEKKDLKTTSSIMDEAELKDEPYYTDKNGVGWFKVTNIPGWMWDGNTIIKKPKKQVKKKGKK